jgi:nucleoid-associated protein YgaU
MTTVTIFPRARPMRPACATGLTGATGPAGATGRVICSLDGSHQRSGAVPRAARCAHSSAPDLRGSRLTARGKAVVALIWLVLAAVAAVPITQWDSASSNRPMATTTVVVEPGATLWELARSLDANADPRLLVDAIVELNGLGSGANIHPGDVLVVPRT